VLDFSPLIYTFVWSLLLGFMMFLAVGFGRGMLYVCCVRLMMRKSKKKEEGKEGEDTINQGNKALVR
jgi:hypothetical protein